MELFVLSINLLLFALFWKYMWSKTLLDRTRDQLFDLRDGARDWFVGNGLSLQSEQYLALRRVLNSYLLHTESITFTRYVATIVVLEKNRACVGNVKEELEQIFLLKDKKIKLYIDDVRRRAAIVLFLHMIKRSMFLSLVFFVLLTLFFLGSCWKAVLQRVVGGSLNISGFRRFAVATAAVMSFISFAPCGRYFSQTHFEEYSMRSPGAVDCRLTRFCW